MTKSRGRLPDVMTEEQLLAQLEQPVGEYYQDEYWFVCGFDDSYIDTSKKEYKEDTPPKTYREAYEEVDIKRLRLDGRVMAAYAFNTNDVYLQRHSTLINPKKYDRDIELKFAVDHEVTHYFDCMYNGMRLINNQMDRARVDRVLEVKAFVVQYLNEAQLYTELKRKNIGSIKHNGEIIPIEDILPESIREIVKAKDFDPNDKNMVGLIVQKASEDWHRTRQNYYDNQAKENAKSKGRGGYKVDLERARIGKTDGEVYDAVVEQSLQNTYIRGGVCVDLSDYRCFVDTMSEEDARKLGLDKSRKWEGYVSAETLLEVDAYLEGLGITDERKKAQYLDQQLKLIGQRDPKADMELKTVLVKHDGIILYADGICEEYDEKGVRSQIWYQDQCYDCAGRGAELGDCGKNGVEDGGCNDDIRGIMISDGEDARKQIRAQLEEYEKSIMESTSKNNDDGNNPEKTISFYKLKSMNNRSR